MNKEKEELNENINIYKKLFSEGAINEKKIPIVEKRVFNKKGTI